MTTSTDTERRVCHEPNCPGASWSRRVAGGPWVCDTHNPPILLDHWEPLPSCPGEFQERLKNHAVSVVVGAMTWSNKEQRRMPIDEATKWGAWVDGKSAIGFDYPTRQAARKAALLAARDALEQKLDSIKSAIADLSEASI